jgi:hypothetical protein
VNPIDLRLAELHATARLADGVLHLVFAGTADATSEQLLATLLTRVHAELCQVPGCEASVDVRGLEFMNSSCFKAFITWIVAVDRLPAGQRYRIRFLCNNAIHWQRRSLKSLIHFGEDIVVVEGA